MGPRKAAAQVERRQEKAASAVLWPQGAARARHRLVSALREAPHQRPALGFTSSETSSPDR